jgi:predicted amidophosphoribosyltransferase
VTADPGTDRGAGGSEPQIAIEAVVSYGGRIRELIEALKYDGQVDHAQFLGHLLFRHLDRSTLPREVDLVLPNPTHVHRGVRHTELLVAAMASADIEHRWRFDNPSGPCIVKVRPTVSSYGQDELGRQRAAEAVERALEVRRPELVKGRRLLVVDDVSATGQQLHAVARTLRAHGAADVKGLVLAQPTLADLTAETAATRSAAALSRLDALRHGGTELGGPSL